MAQEVRHTRAEGYREGALAWPGIAVPEKAWGQHLTTLWGREARATLHYSDLYLAFGCVLGDAQALLHFEDSVLAKTAPQIRRVNGTPSFVDEVTQMARHRLLVADEGEAPRVARYAGRGPLVGWARIAVSRIAINYAKREARGAPLEPEHLALLAPNNPVALDVLKGQYREQFAAALRGAFSDLSEHQRTLLRMRFVDGVDIDRIGRVYGLHRATIARRIASAREMIFEKTKERLEEGLATTMTAESFESVLHLVYSQIDVSVLALLNGEPLSQA